MEAKLTEDEVRTRAERLLGTELGELHTMAKGRIYRSTARGFGGVIVKFDREATPSAPPSPSFLDEWAALKFLAAVPLRPGLVPRLYAGDATARMLIAEDFGPSDSVATALLGDDPSRAVEALGLHAEAVADLHGATVGRETEYQTIRASLGPLPEARPGMGWGRVTERRSALETAFAAIGQVAADPFWREYDALVGAIEDPSPFRAFVHNDSCPDNTILLPDRVRLIDFEVGGFHSALLDATYARLLMPHCWCVQRLPMEVVAATERHYRARLAPAIPESLDDAIFGRRMTEACAYWLISNGTWLVDRNLDGDFEWGPATWHQRVLARLDLFARTTEEFSHLRAMGAAARETRERLLDRWQVPELPLYPAFRGIKTP